VGYDPRNNVYLVVSAHGRVNGRFVSADGAVLGEPFVFQAVPAFGQFPQLAYSPDANGGNGGFLVTWHESDAVVPSVHARMVSYTSGFLTPDRQIFGNDTYHEIMGAPVVYSTVSREFLVVWRQYADVNIFGLRLDNNGGTLGGLIRVAASPLFESDQSLSYNPFNDEYLAVYRMGFSPTSVMAQRIKAGTGALVGGPSIVAQASTVNTTGVTFNPTTGQYLVAWHQMPGDLIAGRAVAIDGTPIGNVTALSTRVGTYDSLSVDANEISGTVLLVGHDKWSVEVGGVEVSGAAAPLSAGQALTASGGNGNHVPKVSSNPARREWMVVAARNFAQTIAQRVGTSTPGGGQPPPPPPPPTATSQPRLHIDYPANGSTVSQSFAVAGWALDLSSTSGSGVAAVHVWAFPTTGGNPVFVGAAELGVARPDISGYFSDARFSYSGFGLLGVLPPGTYDLRVSMLSSVAGTFNLDAFTRITVTAPASLPRMYVDSPVPHQDVAQYFAIAGWAVDLAAPSGSGVDAVHVWAYPIAGGNPVWVGAALLNQPRPDVAAHFGKPGAAYSGYFLQGYLPPAGYNLVVFAHSTVTGTFNQAAVVPITVR
jgi:hypothetical protein